MDAGVLNIDTFAGSNLRDAADHGVAGCIRLLRRQPA
jgi:hypothetical protein